MEKERPIVRRTALRDPVYLRAFLQDSLRNGPVAFRIALREAVRSQEGGFTWLSRRTGIVRTGLYKALSEKGNPSYTTICQILDALGLDSAIVPKAPAPRRQTVGKAAKKIADVDSRAGAAENKEAPQPNKARIEPGSAKGLIRYMADDFDAPLPEFSEYM